MSTRTGEHGPAVFAGESMVGSSKPSWFTEVINDNHVANEGRLLLQEYSNITPDDIIKHVTSVRDRAFAIWPYACIGQIRFLSYSIQALPYKEAVLSRLGDGATFLDAGCCFGQELRFLIHRERIPAKQLYGFDLEPGFIKFGHELFRDEDRLEAAFLSGDLLASRDTPSGQELNSLEGKMDIVHVASVLHSCDWDDMLRATQRLVSFSRPVKGSLIVGNQIGSLSASEYPMPTGKGYSYRHNDETMQKWWREVGTTTGTRWKVSSGMWESQAVRDNKNASFAKADPGLRMIWFDAERI